MPQPFRIFGLMMMVYPKSRGLEGDDDDDDDDYDDSEESGNSCHSELHSPSCKSSDSTGDSQTEDPGEPSTFSIIPGHSCMVKDKQVGLAEDTQAPEEEDQEFQQPFYRDTGMSDNTAGHEEPGLTCHPPGHQRLPAFQKATTARRGFWSSFQHSSGQRSGTKGTAPRALGSDTESTTGAESQEGDSGDREPPTLQPSYDELRRQNSALRWENSTFRQENKTLRNVNFVLVSENSALRQMFKELNKDSAGLVEEDVVLRKEYNVLRKHYERLSGENAALRMDNARVRSTFNTFQDSLKKQAVVVSRLHDHLKASHAERERKTQELQSLVQQTECHLQLMTQRALDAETNVERLKQKIFILQGQLERCKLWNENPRTGWPGSGEAQPRFQQAKPPRAHDGQNWLPQAAPPSGMLPVVAEVLESTRKILKF